MAAPSGADRGGDGGPVDRKADMRRVVDLLVRGIRAKAVPAPRGPAPVDPHWVMSRDGVIGAPLVAEEGGPAGLLP